MRKVFLVLIRLYQYLLSPLFPPNCRFYPTCSEYSYQSIKKHGIIGGIYYTILRLLKCHPFNKGGYDPVK